jgi:hypothetical protein
VQVAQAGGDFFEEQFEGLGFTLTPALSRKREREQFGAIGRLLCLAPSPACGRGLG